MENERLIIGLCLLVAGLVIKEFAAWFKAGRVEKKAVYMTSADCQANREKNCVGKAELESYRAKTDTRLAAMDKRLDQGSKDFKEIGKDLTDIKTTLAGMTALLQATVEKIVITPKTKEKEG